MRKNERGSYLGKAPTLLDCTFRDGGYYNNWEFSDQLFQEYLDVIETSSFAMAEVGFRFTQKMVYMGPHAFTTDFYLSSFSLPKTTEIGVMVNASDFGGTGHPENIVRDLFQEQNKSPLTFVRIASHAREIETAVGVSETLLQMGYRVAINLMQISEVPPEELPSLIAPVNELPLFALYVADSLGSLTPAKSGHLFEILSKATALETGIHAHDNLGLALENSLTALSRGGSFADGTLLGMGRGPGNTRSEELALSLASSEDDLRLAVELGEFAFTRFSEMQKRLGWGRNFIYFLAGQRGVHPSYVQEMMSDSRFDYSLALRATHELSQSAANKFDRTVLQSVGLSSTINGELMGSPIKAPRWVPPRVSSAVIIGPAGLSSTAVRELKLFLANHPETLSLSINGSATPRVGDLTYRVVSNPRQASMISEQLQDPSVPWIVPVDRLGANLGASLADLFDHPFRLGSSFSYGNLGIESPIDNVFAYASGIALDSGASTIFLAGFDGLAGADHRNYEMATLLQILVNKYEVRFVSLTKTSLPIETVSVFSL